MEDDFIGFLRFLLIVFVVVGGTGFILSSIIDLDAKPCPDCVCGDCSASFERRECPPSNVTIVNHYCGTGSFWNGTWIESSNESEWGSNASEGVQATK